MHTVETVKKAIMLGDAGKSNCHPECLAYLKHHSQTGPGTRHILNQLLATNEETYLEVGMYHGGSLSSALIGNQVHCAYGIDMLHNGYEDEMRMDIMASLKRFHKPSNGRVVLHFEDAFKFDVQRIQDPVTVYLYDADHTAEGHRKGITHFWPTLAKRFVLVVDDWKWSDVRDGTEEGLHDVGAKIVFKEILLDKDKYYNGLTVWLIEK